MSRNYLRQVCRFESWNENSSSKVAFEQFVRRNRETFWVAEFHSAVIRSLKCLKMSANISPSIESVSRAHKNTFQSLREAEILTELEKKPLRFSIETFDYFIKFSLFFNDPRFSECFWDIFRLKMFQVSWVWTVEMWIFLAHHNLLSKQASFAF